MSESTIIGKPTIIVVDDSSDWIEQLEFSLGDKYLIIATSDLEAAAEIARRYLPEVILLDWQIAQRDPERARLGIARENEEAIAVILITGFERPEVSNLADLIGGCIAVVERMDTLEELKREIAKVVSCADG